MGQNMEESRPKGRAGWRAKHVVKCAVKGTEQGRAEQGSCRGRPGQVIGQDSAVQEMKGQNSTGQDRIRQKRAGACQHWTGEGTR